MFKTAEKRLGRRALQKAVDAAATSRLAVAASPLEFLVMPNRVKDLLAHAGALDNLPRRGTALQALTAAAMLLPGLNCTPVVAADTSSTIALQYGNYAEGERSIGSTAPNQQAPIRVDSFRGTAQFGLGENGTLQVNFVQDTWTGATPIATAPLSLGGNRPIKFGSAGQLVTVGASPMITGKVSLTRDFGLLANDPLVHTMSSASPETRRQFDSKLTRSLQNGTLATGAGLSEERDYRSILLNVARRWDLSQNLTSITSALSYTASETSATLDHDAAPYITKTAFLNQIQTSGALQTLSGSRKDWGGTLGIVQVMGPSTLIESTLGSSLSIGYLSNPYKVMTTIFADPAGLAAGATELVGDSQALLEQRPTSRRTWSAGLRLNQYVTPFDASLRLGMRRYVDDWGITSNAYDVQWVQPLRDGWTVSPRVRYYSQTAANFYRPFLVSPQAFRKVAISADGDVTVTPFDPRKLPLYFSSDQRLAAFGSWTMGLSAAKQLTKGIALEAGFEVTRQASGLQPGGSSDGSFADFSYRMANLAVKFDLDAKEAFKTAPGKHLHSHADSTSTAPAGVMFAHPTLGAGEWVLGYRFMSSLAGGGMRSGSRELSDTEAMQTGCGAGICYSRPTQMTMNMHMLDVMVGLKEGISLMLMPQFLGMAMESKLSSNTTAVPIGASVHTGIHETGGFGDISASLVFDLKRSSEENLLASLGVNVPVGNSAVQLRRTHQTPPRFADYGMQLGSGTWDLQTSLTYLHEHSSHPWGVQLQSTTRLQVVNEQGYSPGETWQAGAWVSQRVNSWLSASIRGTYTNQSSVTGRFNQNEAATSSVDLPSNYGGRYFDIGFGARIQFSSGVYRGSSLAAEWTRPLFVHSNGVQLNRNGTFHLAGMMHF